MSSDEQLLAAAAVLRRGGTVAFPTETVYGLGAHAMDALAVARIYEAKERPSFDPLIVHIASADSIMDLVTDFPTDAQRLASRFWPGPLTLVLPKREIVPDIVTAGRPTVAVRVPAHPVALELLHAVSFPIAAPSANKFGQTSPTTADHVRAQLSDRVDHILDGGACTVGVESTIVSFTGAPKLLRPGGTPLEEIEAVIGSIEIPADEDPSASPGRAERHYATRTRLSLDGTPSGRAGLLTLVEPPDRSPYEVVEVLSPTGDLREAAAGLFAAMRRLDAHGLDVIIAESVPETGLGRAIMDRLRRAASPL